MRIIYLTPLRYPSKYTNRLQVLKMAEAFSARGDFALYIEQLPASKDALFQDYAIAHAFSIESVGSPKIWPRSFWLARRYRALIKRQPQGTVFYTRDVLLAFFLTYCSKRFREQFFFENHSLGKFPNFVYQRVFGLARGIVTTNAHKKEDIIKKFSIASDHILVFGNGIDLGRFARLKSKTDARLALGMKTDKPNIVYTGTIAESYGSGVIKRMQELLRGEVYIHAITGLPGSVALDYITAADIGLAPYLAASDHFRYYMSPMKIKEYMAAGKTIVVSDLPAIREILSEDAAYFAPPGDTEAFVGAVRRAIMHPEEAVAKAYHARELAREFSWDRRADAITLFIEQRI